MRKIAHRPAVVLLLAMVASLLGVVAPGTAYAVIEPTLQWPAVTAKARTGVTSTLDGEVTVSCDPWGSGQELTTYDASGAVVRHLPRTPQVDGVDNCILEPTVDKNGDLYGIPYGGPNLLAYDGNTLKWKYPARC